MLLVKMDHLDKWTRARRANADFYRQNLGSSTELVVPDEDTPHQFSVYHTYVTRHPQRDELRTFLDEAGIETKVHYPVPIHLQPAARSLGYAAGRFPKAERLAETMVSLPVHPGLSAQQLEMVVHRIHEFHEQAGVPKV